MSLLFPRTLVRAASLLVALLAVLISSSPTFAAEATPAASPVATGSPYAKEFFEARERATSDFELEVLADDLITHAEYAEAVDRFVSCMQEAGHDFAAVASPDVPGMWWYESRIPDAAMESTPAADAFFAEQNADFDRCSTGTTFQIEALYHEILTNPTHLDNAELIATCFAVTGLTDGTFTGDDFTEAFTSEDNAFPFDQGDARFQSCVNNPNQTGLPDQITEPDARMLPPSDWNAATPVATPAS